MRWFCPSCIPAAARCSPARQVRIGALAASMFILLSAPASANFRENFEGPEVSWRYSGTDAAVRIEVHERARSQAHWGHGCERIRCTMGHGTHLYFRHEIGRPQVIAELEPSVWVKADRPGIQLLARVVFPRSLDPDTGQPVTTLVQGQTSRRSGAWQRLAVTDLPQLVARQARVLRLQLGRDVDERQAYLDLLVLNVYGGRGATEVLIDDLEVEGYLPAGDVRPASPADAPPIEPASFGQRPAEPEALRQRDNGVQLQGSVLTAGGRPLFPRIIEHRGEPFERLQQLGFNTLRLATPPSPWQLAEAQRHGLWIVCPPPDVLAGRSIGPGHHRVVAWDLGSGLAGRQLRGVRELATAVRRADEQTARPLLAAAAEQLRLYSRTADILLFDERPLGTARQLDRFADRIDERRRLTRPGTPAWVAVQTQPPASLVDQWAGFGGPAPHVVEPDQLRLLTYSALASGPRALLFTSHEQLDQNDQQAQLRSKTLELLNLELELIDPWLAIGSQPHGIRTANPTAQATLFATDHSHLVLARRIEPNAQYVTPPPRRQPLSLVVPGIPESSEAYLVSPAGLRPLKHRRCTGGVRVTVNDFGWTAAIVFTSDPLVYARLAHLSAQQRQRAAELRTAIGAIMLARTRSLIESMSQVRRLPAETSPTLALAKANLGQCERMLASGDAQSAYDFALRASHALARLRLSIWETAAHQFGPPPSHPALASFETLPLLPADDRSSQPTTGATRLAGGNMENLDQMMRSGWRHFRREVPGVTSQVELSHVRPFSGRYALRLEASSDDERDAAGPLESPPVWIRSGGVRVHAGQRFVVRGRVRIDSAQSDAGDGLLVYDSLGGRSLGVPIRQTDAWQSFHFHRVATRDAMVHVNFELGNLGEAMIDDVEVAIHDAAARPRSAAGDTPAISRLRRIFASPR